MYDLFASTITKKAPISWQLRFRTPDRNMRHLFGDAEGEKIYREIFYPVQRNEAEKYRFINRMYEEVREITGQDGQKKELTKQESALAMQVVEGRAAAEKVAASEMSEAIKHAVASWQNGGDFAEEAKAFNLGKNEKDLAKEYARWLEIEASLEDPSVDKVRVNNAADKYSEMFNKFYDAIVNVYYFFILMYT